MIKWYFNSCLQGRNGNIRKKLWPGSSLWARACLPLPSFIFSCEVNSRTLLYWCPSLSLAVPLHLPFPVAPSSSLSPLFTSACFPSFPTFLWSGKTSSTQNSWSGTQVPFCFLFLKAVRWSREIGDLGYLEGHWTSGKSTWDWTPALLGSYLCNPEQDTESLQVSQLPLV